jgi:hypothetical protein
MIETVINSNIETLLNLFTWGGVVLTVIGIAIVCKVVTTHNL